MLTRVLSDGIALDDALTGLDPAPTPAGRAWLQEVCSGTLRWRGRLDAAIDAGALKKKPSGWLRKVLLVAAYQLIAQDRTSPAAVVSETVNLVKSREGDAPAKFANALLRKVADHALEWRELPLRFGAKIAEGAQWASLPEWLWKRLWKERGVDWAKEYARASLDRPVLWLRSREKDWRALGFEHGELPGSLFAAEGAGSPTEIAGFQKGEFIVQDISSQTLVREIAELAPGKRALDLCAAPGGKSVGLAWSGFAVTATDSNPVRLKLVHETLARIPDTKIQVLPLVAALAEKDFDLVWVDAPCTGSGILRRHPDVRWLRRETDLAALLLTQRQLLRQGWERVRPGGMLAYSVCSVLSEEGPGALADFRAEFPEAKVVREWALTPAQKPHGDGFWAVLLQK